MNILVLSLFILSVLGLLGLILSKISQLSGQMPVRIKLAQAQNHGRLWPYFRKKLGLLGQIVWHFILEAKDLKPAATKTMQSQIERVRKVFRVRIRGSENEPQWMPEAAELTAKTETAQSPEDLYLQAIKRDPNDRHAYEALGRLYLQNQNFEDGAQIYEYLIALDPGRDIYFSNLGLAQFSLGQFSKAAASYEKALGINNKVPARWINLALCFDALEEYTKAVKAISSALELDRLNLNYLSLLADVYLKLDNNIRAEEVLEKILTQEPTNRLARERLMKLRV